MTSLKSASNRFQSASRSSGNAGSGPDFAADWPATRPCSAGPASAELSSPYSILISTAAVRLARLDRGEQMAEHDRSLYTMYLHQVPMLRTCSQDEIDHIAELGVTVLASEGQDIIRQGEAGNQFFVITEGSAAVARGGHRVASLVPGDYFGELALFDPAPRNATVTATSPTTLVSVSRNPFRELLGEVSSLRDALLAGMATRLHELDGRA